MPDLYSPGVIRALLERYGLRMQKALGQNFIINPGVCPRIAELGGARTGVGALEIGPGIGVLTAQLARRCDKVVAIELDKGLLPLLDETLGEFSNINIIHGDVLKLDLPSLLRSEFGQMPVIVCANLPYYITTPIIMQLLESRLPFESITVMVQKDTAQRFCAPLPSRQAGAVTVSIAWYADCQHLFDVGKGSFLPAPKVDSSVIKLVPRLHPPFAVRDESVLFKAIRGAFSQRRKTLLNCLSGAFSLPKAEMSAILNAAGVDPTSRAEQLDLAAFVRIANALAD